jgi:PPE-repeat protein
VTAALDFAMLPPEINSGRMYSGAGAGPMLAAASAWTRLAAELRATALSYDSVLTALMGEDWLGPASVSMAAAASPYVAWMSATAMQAEQTAAQAEAAAAAYEMAFAATVPPPLVADNRARLMTLTATNIVGQNTPAIAATEAQYAEMWAQDAAAMYSYVASSAAASQVSPFTPPPNIASPGAMPAQSAAVAQSAAMAAGTQQTTLSQLVSAAPFPPNGVVLPSTADGLASGWDIFAPGSGSVTTGPLGLLNAIFGSETAAGKVLNSNLLNTISGSGLVSPANTVGPFISLMGAGSGAVPTDAAGAASAGTAATAIDGALTGQVQAMGGLGERLSGGVGQAATVGSLSVPPNWTAAAPPNWTAAAPPAGPLASPLGGTPVDAPPPAMAAGMPGAPLGTFVSQSRGRGVHPYGFRPTFIARPPAAG